MSKCEVFFIQSCPVCGRSLRVLVRLLGRSMKCGHCGGSFLAEDRPSSETSKETRVIELLRVDPRTACRSRYYGTTSANTRN